MPLPTILSGNVASATAGAYEVANSCRFNDGDSAYMSRTLGTPTNNDRWTFSCWVKRGNIDTQQVLFAGSADSNNGTVIQFKNTEQLQWQEYQSSFLGKYTTNRLFRDPSAWYHLVFTYDSGNATAGDRMRIYVNGTEETSFADETNVDQNQDSLMNTAVAHGIGYDTGTGIAGSYYFDGYMAEVCFCDGQAYAASDFGEFDEDSPTIWKPKKVSTLTFGSNGFYLDFKDSANLGNDANGGTDWAETNIAAVDQYIDTPTNNFATMNPLGGECTLSQGNTLVQHSGSANDQQNSHTTLAVSKGRWYAEMMVTMHATSGSGRYYPGIGVSDVSVPAASNPISNTYMGGVTGTYSFMANGQTDYAGSQTGGDASSEYATNDIVGIYLDLESGTKTMKIHKNGTEIESTTIAAPITFYAIGNNIHSNGSNSRAKWNFGSGQYDGTAVSSGNADPNGYGSFEYSTTENSVDYYALCTKNIAEFG